MRTLVLLLIFSLQSYSSFSQNIRFSQQIINNGNGTSTVNFSAVNTGGASENLGGFTIYYYYDNSETTVVSSDFTTVTGNSMGQLNWGTANQSVENHVATVNPLVTIVSSGYFYYQNFDNNFTGRIMTSNEVLQLGSVTFNHAVGTSASGSGYLSSSTQDPPIVYFNFPAFTPNPINISGVQFGPLPVDIKSFSATKDGDRNVFLDWSTSLEINSAYFGIERSIDGTSWEGISKVAAAGNSNTEQLYTYTDRDLPLNRSKDQSCDYRLQLVDLDGQYKYSDIRGVNFGKENTNKVISLYPNPAVQMVNLDLSGMDLESGAIHLRVTDMQGRNMIDKTILGNGIEPIEVTQLPAGTYNVAVSQGANLYQKQFIKIE